MKKQKRYRYRKTTPEILEKMKKARESGLFYVDVAKKFNISASSAQYWLSPQEKEKSKKRSMKSNSKLTRKQRKDKNNKNYEYTKKYLTERYNNDEEFKKRMISYVQKSFKRKSKEWRKKGLCVICGRKRENKRWKQCEKCREKHRKTWRKRKNETLQI